VKLSLLSKERRTAEQRYTTTDEPVRAPSVRSDASNEITAIIHEADVHWLAN
jgi:ligand-binding sensor domain-containing protein